MSENSLPATTGHSRPPGQGAAEQADAPEGGVDADATARPDRVPTADAFDTLTSFDAHGPGEGDDNNGNSRRAVGGDDVPLSATARWLSRLPGERRHWTIGAMVAGGVLLGGLLSGGIAWKMVSSRDVEVAARTVRLDAQSSRLAEQAAKIEVLTRAISERPLPDDPVAETDVRSGTPATAARASTSAPTTPGVPAVAAAVDKAAASPALPPGAGGQVVTAPASAAPPAVVVSRAEVPRRTEPEAKGLAAASPGQAGSGICDVPGGSDGAAKMRRCIEWFAGRDKGATRPVP